MRPGLFVRALAALTLISAAAPAAQAQLLGANHVKAGLAAQTDGAAPGSTLYVALTQNIDKGWHTYWRNPGDSGEATKIAWTLPAGWRAGDIVWPAPKRLPLGPLMNYGYEGQVLLPVPIEVPADAKAGQVAHLSAIASFLVCADVCVPQDATVTLDVPIVAGAPPLDPAWGAAISNTLAAAPKPSGLAASFQSIGGVLRVAVAGPGLAGQDMTGAYFYPYDGRALDMAKPQAIDAGKQGVTLAVIPGEAFQQGPAPGEIDGVLQTVGGAYEVDARPGPPPPGSGGLGAPAGPDLGGKLVLAIASAFLGGLILNLMPCVFPILSMKAASLIGHPHEAARARGQGLAFLAGVMVTFLALAGGIIAARAAGQAAVGWGSQLQPAVVTASLALVMLAAALDLSGVFEVGASIQGLGSGLAGRADLLGSAFTGALAVVVAAPCTAPFMGPALGFALTQPAPAALAVFAGLGLGFAAPFTALAFSPFLLRHLPKPGAWMDVFKKVLAFPMYAAAAWLVWVLAQQTDSGSLAAVFAAAVLVGLAAWVFGAAQRRSASGAKARWVYGIAAVVVALAVGAVAAAPYGPPPKAGATAAIAAGVPSEPWSPARVVALQAQGKPLFVDFTAAWCVTCQVNEQTALNTAEAAAAFKRSGAVYLKADWTNRDPMIAQALTEQGRAGVPLYLVYGASGGAPKVLPQLLTSGLVAQALDAASLRPPASAGR